MAVVCAAGVLYGVYYYLPQLARTPLALWPFAPDTPLAVAWALLALTSYWTHRRGGAIDERPGVAAATIDALAFVGNLQVGVWAVFVLLRYADAFDTFAWNASTLLLASHIGMVLLAFVFVGGVRERFEREPAAQAIGVSVAAAFYVVQDALDYVGPDFMGRGCGMRPHTVPCDPALEATLGAFTLALTAAVVVVLLALARPRRRSSP